MPHADLHVVRSGTPKPTLKLDVRLRSVTDPVAQKVYDLESVLDPAKYQVDFTVFAPHNEPPHRFDGVPKIAADGTVDVAQAALGVYLFQVGVQKKQPVGTSQVGSVVGRIQVHERFVDWWFGNGSITTALDSRFAHAQPSLYAKFSDDGSGADLVGDITGHGYVTLVSNSASVAVADRGRLQGLVETAAPVTVTGTFLEQPPLSKPPLVLPVRVVDYGKSRPVLEPVRVPDVAHADAKANIVFLAEGFRQADRPLFDRLVQQTADEMFTKPRHEPYGMLKNSFNVFKVFTPSQDEQATCGFHVTDNTVGFGVKGVPIPSAPAYPKALKGSYRLRQLVELVGLPKRGENRNTQQLKALWARQQIPGFDPRQADDALIEAWKAHRSDGVLQASDTMFGLYLGSRWADGSRVPTTTTLAAPVPGKDDPTDPIERPKLAALITRLHHFYMMRPQQALTLDPRRHPPELYANENLVNPGNSILSYLGGLRYSLPPNPPIGTNWVPDSSTVKQSKGLVSIISYDGVNGGSAINLDTLTSSTVANSAPVPFTSDAARPELLRRTTPAPPSPARPLGVVDLDSFINKAAHEFGHVFDLEDEYEEFGLSDDSDDALGARDIPTDNITSIGFLRSSPAPARTLAVDRVKWLVLPRIRVSSRLVEATLPDTARPRQITVTVGPDEIAKWVQARADGAEVSLLNRSAQPNRQQLPLPPTNQLDYLTGLRIVEVRDEARGIFVLEGPSTVTIQQSFREGSVVFVPRRNPGGSPSFVVEEEVVAFLRSTRLPLNSNRVLTVPSRDDQLPVPIFNFRPPFHSFLTVGLYEGARHVSRGFYRPTGACKMRNQDDQVHDGRQFCHVCKWLLVNLVDGGQHALLDRQFYPSSPRGRR
ncbi:M64 family metallopeptidase [Streptomyces spectabilis]|uniref:Uncharacterized protein n=1 Tax=Streptomyces spectabilis TaxID=68270 RepID=A0A516R1Q4_STRST|nr:M64 family metallopeptidase [Streptomyces spectabilis]QDQ09589.1 hypothetical protein FH965_02630 [Streptomyces spectabilis]